MGLFNGYLKEGPGVSKNQKEKHRFFLFFELFGRKFSKLICLNILYIAMLIPLIIGLVSSLMVNPLLIGEEGINTTILATQPIIQFSGNIPGMIIFVLSLFLAGPATAGFVYVIRNFQREEHAWVLSDFFEHFRKNFKQATAMAFIDAIVYFMLYVAFVFYAYMIKDVNDSDECAQKLANLVKGIKCYVNLIPYNETSNSAFRKSDKERISSFFDILKKNGINVTVRREFGGELKAACGQLSAEHSKRN